MKVNNSSTYILIYFQFLLFIIFLFDFKFTIGFHQNILIIIFLECLLISLIDKKFNVFQVFLLMMFLFSLAIPFFIVFGIYEYPPGNRIMLGDGMSTIISDNTLIETYNVLSVILLGTSVGWLLGKLKFNMNVYRLKDSLSNKIFDNSLAYLIKILFFILFPLVIYNNTVLVYYSLMYGYVEVMHLHSINLNTNIIFIISDMLFKMSGYSLIFFSRKKEEFIKYSIFFMIPYIIQFATGVRGETIVVFLTLIFIYSCLFQQIDFKKIIPTSIFIFIFSTVFGAYRFSRDFEILFNNFSIYDLIILGIVSNASSIGVLAYTIQLKDQFFNQTSFLFGYIQGIFSFAPNYTLEGIYNKNYLAQHITYLINPNKLFGGSTIGTSQGAEFYEFSDGNLILIFLLSLILLYLACFLISRLNNNLLLFVFAAFYLELLWLSPRGSIMKFFSKETVFAFTILFLIIKLSKYFFIKNNFKLKP